ncbi:hypothetical protein N7535_009357 [Penicillium sp. DV-2018c]|nr:hypothetical protein N7535_009357 [Penicillium sp. DV-2018c]
MAGFSSLAQLLKKVRDKARNLLPQKFQKHSSEQTSPPLSGGVLVRGEVHFPPRPVTLIDDRGAPRTSQPLPRSLSTRVRLVEEGEEIAGLFFWEEGAMGDRSRAADMGDTSRRPEIVDLTMSGANPTHGSRTSSPTALPPMPTTIHLDDNGEGPSTSSRGIKRRHDERDGHAESSGSASTRQRRHSIEILDMTGEKSAIEPPQLAPRSRSSIDSETNPLLGYRCPICLDRPVDPTSTTCGHIFCHQCICSHLEFHPGDRAGEAKPSKGTCPVCRTLISRSDSGKARGLVPLVFKKNRKVEDAASTDS